MHSTIQQSPTPRQQIKRLLTVLALAMFCGTATVGLMLYTAPAKTSFILADVLISPETLPRIALEDAPASQKGVMTAPRTWRFDSITLSLNDPLTHKRVERTLSQAEYAELYSHLSSDTSQSDAKSATAQALFSKEEAVDLSIWLASEQVPEKRLLQTVLFYPHASLYRVMLYQLNPTSEHTWALYHHEGLSNLLQPLMQDAL